MNRSDVESCSYEVFYASSSRSAPAQFGATLSWLVGHTGVPDAAIRPIRPLYGVRLRSSIHPLRPTVLGYAEFRSTCGAHLGRDDRLPSKHNANLKFARSRCASERLPGVIDMSSVDNSMQV